ncbi:hypothetical protein CK203_089377 [Vitis vinifera]|uniref:Uncharacterized protein n=1 Tax=Vitis vinifera TaxID=29760 RepID=A0A438E933_VITVI|nr:hypothetical protein CK203_089377 [Vitis vinifera]
MKSRGIYDPYHSKEIWALKTKGRINLFIKCLHKANLCIIIHRKVSEVRKRPSRDNYAVNSRLNWFLVSEDWEGGVVRRGPMPFRFENMWLKEEGFKDKLQAWWESLNFNGIASFVLGAKLKALKPLLREWNRNVFGKVEVNKALVLNQVEFWDNVEVAWPLAVHELEARRGAKEDFKKWVFLEDISWRQKSRELG